MSGLVNGRSEAGKLVSGFVDAVEALLRRFGADRRWVAVEEGEGLVLWKVQGGKPERIGDAGTLGGKSRKALAKAGAELRLDPEKLVSASLKLPAEARGFAAQVIDHRLEKLTPWRPEKLLYGFDVAAAAGGDGQHEVRFLATSRDIADAALTRVRALGAEVSALGSAAEPLDRPLAINLLGAGAGKARLRRRRVIAGVAVGVLAASLALFAWSQWLLSDVESRQAELDARIAGIRERIAAGSSGGRREDLDLIQSKTPGRAVFTLIDRLARALPDDTVLDEMEIKPDSVRVAGSSADASALVGRLEADAFLRDAEFAAPVTRQLDGRDRFDIVLSRESQPREGQPVDGSGS